MSSPESRRFRRQVLLYLHYFVLSKRAYFPRQKKKPSGKNFPTAYSAAKGSIGPFIFKFLSLFIFLLGFRATVEGQSHQLGARLGYYSGISYRYMSAGDVGVEANLSRWLPYHGATLSVLAEKNFPVKNGFSLYLGAGLFLGSYRDAYYYRYRNRYSRYYFEGTYAGLETVIGADYKFATAPLIIGMDIRPRFINFIYPYLWDGGLNIRYVF